MRRLLLVAGAVWSIAASAHAEERFVWSAPRECPSAERVLDTVAELAGPRPLDLAPFDSIRGDVERVERGWQLTLTLSDGGHRRSRHMVAPSCEALVQAAGVALALALDGARGRAEHLGSEPASGANALDARSSEPNPAVAMRPEKPSPAEARDEDTASEGVNGQSVAFAVAGEAILDAAALPHPGLGLALSVGVRGAAWSAMALGLLLPAQRTDTDPGGAVEFSLLAAGARGCHVIARWLVETSACASAELGRLGAAGVGLNRAASFADWWLAGAAGVELSGSLGKGWLWVGRGDVVVPFFHERYSVDGVDGSQLVHRASLPGLRLGVGVQVVLP